MIHVCSALWGRKTLLIEKSNMRIHLLWQNEAWHCWTTPPHLKLLHIKACWARASIILLSASENFHVHKFWHFWQTWRSWRLCKGGIFLSEFWSKPPIINVHNAVSSSVPSKPKLPHYQAVRKKLDIDYLLKVILLCLYGATLVQTNPTSNPEVWASLTVHQYSCVIDLKWSVETQNQL